MNFLQNIQSQHIALILMGVALIIFVFKGGGFIREAVSEKDAVTGECFISHKRLAAFLLVIAAIVCEIYHTIKQQKFDVEHLIVFLSGALLYSGVATVAQLMTIWKGKVPEIVNKVSAKVEIEQTQTT